MKRILRRIFNTKIGKIALHILVVSFACFIGFPFYYLSKIFKIIGYFGLGKFYSMMDECKDWSIWSSDIRDEF